MSDLTEEQRSAIGQRLLEGRQRAAAEKAAHPLLAVSPEDHVTPAEGLDIATPSKWQMKIRLYLESLSPAEADAWMGELRLIATMAGRVVRDQVYARTTMRCYVCERPFKDGRPACEAGYLDADREYIKIYACDQSEFPELIKAVKKKEDEVALQEERAEKAARQAAKDARSRIMRE